MEIQEDTIWTKYKYLVPPKNRIPRKSFHSLYEEYRAHPERKTALVAKLRSMTLKNGFTPAKKGAFSKKKGGKKSRRVGRSRRARR